MTGERVFEALTDCADELEGEIVARYVHADGVHPAMQHKYDRDMQTVIDARLAIDTLRAQVAALAVVMDALGEESINCDNLHHGPKDYHAAFSEPCPVQARVKAALDAARGGEG